MNCELTSPILSRRPSLNEWFENHISKEKKETFLGIPSSKLVLAALVILRNLCFVSLNSKLPGQPYTLGIFAAGNVVAISGLDYWAGSKFLDDLFSDIGISQVFPEEKSLSKTAIIAIFVLALISQIPAVYAALEYNQKSLSIPIDFAVFLGGAVIPLRSIQLSVQKYFREKGASTEQITLQKDFIKLLKENKQRFINMTPLEKESFVNKLCEIRDIVNPSERLQSYVCHLIEKMPIAKIEPGCGSNAAKAMGYILSGIYQTATGLYTFSKTKENVLDDDIFATFTAIFVVAASLYLTNSAIVNSSTKVFHQVSGYASQESLAKKLRNKTICNLEWAGIATNILALGVSYVIWKDFFKNDTERVFFESTMCIAVFLLLYTSTPSVIHDFVEGYLSWKGTEEEKKAIEMSGEYETLISAMDSISSKNFEQVHSLLFPETQNIKNPENIIAIINPMSDEENKFQEIEIE